MEDWLSRFWYRFKNWFRTKPGAEEPLRFLCGSEEELRRVTMWICHVRPHLFDAGKKITVDYWSPSPEKAGGGAIEGFWDDDWYLHIDVVPTSEYEFSWQWCSLVFKHNAFAGFCRLAAHPYFFSRRHVVEIQINLKVIVHPPSAHERAEALLALSEWLDGKVSEEEKRELLQLPDDMEV